MTARFLVLEGLDGAGTTTQAERLVAHCGPGTVATHEPTDGPVGRIARQSLRAAPDAPPVQAMPWLFAADRADHLFRRVEPALAAGHDVVSDRYLPSSLAYQSLTLPLDDVWDLNKRFRVPDVVLFVEVDVATALARIDARAGTREIYDDEQRLTAVHAAYDRVFGFLEGQGWPVVRIDGTQSIEAVWTAIARAVS
jgi:dTMP kinase